MDDQTSSTPIPDPNGASLPSDPGAASLPADPAPAPEAPADPAVAPEAPAVEPDPNSGVPPAAPSEL